MSERNPAWPQIMHWSDLKLRPGKRRRYALSGSINIPAAYVHTKGFSGLSNRAGQSWRTLPYALESARRATHERCWGESRWD